MGRWDPVTDCRTLIPVKISRKVRQDRKGLKVNCCISLRCSASLREKLN